MNGTPEDNNARIARRVTDEAKTVAGEAAERLYDEYADGPKKKTAEEILNATGPCQVTALGHSMRENTNTVHFLDAKGQVRSFGGGGLRASTILDLFFGDLTWLQSTSPNLTGDGNHLSGDKATWKSTHVAPLLLRACDAAGFFEPDDMVRGPGVWPYGAVDEWPRVDRRIVVHTGDQVWLITPAPIDVDADGRSLTDANARGTVKNHRAGLRLGDFVYSRSAAENPPDEEALSDEDAARLIRFNGSWAWEESKAVDGVPLAQFLLLGWHAAACIPALLHRRPSLFAQGPSGAGKSELCTYSQYMLGAGSIRFENATMTGIRGRFIGSHPARALICNEANKRVTPQDVQKLREILDLALYCYTSGESNQLRGPGGLSGSLSAIFMFAAADPPVLQKMDANRMLLLRMRPLKVDVQALADFTAAREEVKPLGPKLRRRMLERWPKYPSVFHGFEKSLVSLGYETREADTFGTLLACAWLASRSGLPSELECYEWAMAVSGSLFVQAADESEADWKRCWTHLTTTKVEYSKEKPRRAIGDLLDEALGHDPTNTGAARVSLKNFGLARVMRVSHAAKKAHLELVAKAEQGGGAMPHEPVPTEWIAVSYSHEGLADIFRGSTWRDGGWLSPLAGTPGAERNHPANFAGQGRGKALLIPVDLLKRQPGDEAYADDPREEVVRAVADDVK